MARKTKATHQPESKPQVLGEITVSTPPLAPRAKALVFISHDSRDSQIAEAFANLLSDISVGTIKTFRSSDNLGTTGIAFGDEWYDAIVKKLGEATDVIALLTSTSVDRPWILYEAGIAAGKLDTRVIGVAIGLPLSKAITGPFSQFQNSADDEPSLTKLMLQLLQRNPDAAPRPETVAMHVRTFREKAAEILKAKGGDDEVELPSEEENVAILVEEMKGMLRELPDRLSERGIGGRRTKSRRANLRFLEAIAFGPAFHRFDDGASLALVTIASIVRDEMPWLYEPAVEFHRSLHRKTNGAAQEMAHQLHELVDMARHGPLADEAVDNETFHFAGRIMHELIEKAVRARRVPRTRAPVEETSKKNS